MQLHRYTRPAWAMQTHLDDPDVITFGRAALDYPIELSRCDTIETDQSDEEVSIRITHGETTVIGLDMAAQDGIPIADVSRLAAALLELAAAYEASQ